MSLFCFEILTHPRHNDGHYSQETDAGKSVGRRKIYTLLVRMLSSLLGESTYKRGKPIPRQSILGFWSQLVGNVQNRMFFRNVSVASHRVAMSWREQ